MVKIYLEYDKVSINKVVTEFDENQCFNLYDEVNSLIYAHPELGIEDHENPFPLKYESDDGLYLWYIGFPNEEKFREATVWVRRT